MKEDLLIHGGLVIDPASGLQARRDVLARRGRVARVAPGLEKRLPARPRGLRRLDARGCWVVPGLIDLHVHLREPGGEEGETIATGTTAAAAGGVSAVVAMANTRPATDTPARLARVLASARRTASVRVLPAAAVTRGLQGRELTDMRRLADAGAAAFSDDGRPVMSARLMLEALKTARELGRPLLDHAEDLDLSEGGVLNEGPACRRCRVPGIPPASETAMAARDVALAEAAGGPLHLCHVSCAGTVELVRRAKEKGLGVTAEACPHHFTLADADIRRCDPDFKMKPPLRSRADVEAVRRGLADGTIDAIATDHAPHPARLKGRGLAAAPFGIIGLETLLPLSLALVREGVLTPRSLVERLSLGPAKILGLQRSRGHLRAGADADITVIDPAGRWTGAPFKSKSGNSPFRGRRLRGQARATVVGGVVAYSGESR